jgi:hypothetical protein
MSSSSRVRLGEGPNIFQMFLQAILGAEDVGKAGMGKSPFIGGSGPHSVRKRRKASLICGFTDAREYSKLREMKTGT